MAHELQLNSVLVVAQVVRGLPEPQRSRAKALIQAMADVKAHGEAGSELVRILADIEGESLRQVAVILDARSEEGVTLWDHLLEE